MVTLFNLFPTNGAVSIDNLTPDLFRTLTVSNNLTDTDGAVSLLGYQWQASLDGTGWSDIPGAVSASFTTTTSGVQLRVVASYTVGGGAVETMMSGVTAAVGAFHIIEGTNPAGEKLTGTAVADEILGLGGDDTLNGLAGNDILTGGAGNDYLTGGVGADTMFGNLGNDTYSVDATGDVVNEDAGKGTDRVISSIDYVLPDNVENLSFTGTKAIIGTGNALDNVITGSSANNTLSGGDGNDILNGGLGADTMFGGRDNDTYHVDNGNDSVNETAGEGTDMVNSSISYSLTANVENLYLSNAAAIIGMGNELNNAITGSSADNMLWGGDGNDILDGRVGADEMNGGRGNDVYHVDNAGDTVIESPGEGADSVISSINDVLAAGVETLKLIGTAITGSGNELDNFIVGNSTNNILQGLDGNDELKGGAGNDEMIGGMGNDTYWVTDVGDIVTEVASQGTDLVNSSLTYTLKENVENLALNGTAVINGTGNALDNVITGNSTNNTLSGGDGRDTLFGGSGDDILIGGIGADTMYGGLGNDAYYVDNVEDIVDETEGGGIDRVVTSITYTLGEGIERFALTGTVAINGTGNALDNAITGNSVNNTLSGADGNDQLTGNAGRDTLIGGNGNDRFIFSAVGDSGSTAGLRDIITDFVSGTDVIQLTAIDANTGVAGDQTFMMIHNSAFTGVAGQLRFYVESGNTFLEGDVNGDMVVDFAVELTGVHSFGATDLLF